MTAARITSKGQITIPKTVRDRLGVQPGDSLDFRFEGEHLEVRKIPRRSILEFEGLFAVQEPPDSFDWEQQRDQAWREMTRRLTPDG